MPRPLALRLAKLIRDIVRYESVGSRYDQGSDLGRYVQHRGNHRTHDAESAVVAEILAEYGLPGGLNPLPINTINTAKVVELRTP
jgi:hypothetical protein